MQLWRRFAPCGRSLKQTRNWVSTVSFLLRLPQILLMRCRCCQSRLFLSAVPFSQSSASTSLSESPVCSSCRPPASASSSVLSRPSQSGLSSTTVLVVVVILLILVVLVQLASISCTTNTNVVYTLLLVVLLYVQTNV